MVPRGGSDAVNPAWRKALIHAGELNIPADVECSDTDTCAVTSQHWTPLDETARAETEYSIDKVQTEALRQLLPDSGAYVNEVCLSSHVWDNH